VLYASLEFVLPLRGIKAQVGGLGKVIGIVMNFLPEDIGLCIPTYSDLEYNPDIEDSDAIMVQVGSFEGSAFRSASAAPRPHVPHNAIPSQPTRKVLWTPVSLICPAVPTAATSSAPQSDFAGGVWCERQPWCDERERGVCV